MPKVRTHYDNLKVSIDAPLEVIRAAHKTLSLMYHPDRNVENPHSTQIMQTINAAYQVLSDPAQRREHDLWILEQEEIWSRDFTAAPSVPHPRQRWAFAAGRLFRHALRNWVWYLMAWAVIYSGFRYLNIP